MKGLKLEYSNISKFQREEYTKQINDIKAYTDMVNNIEYDNYDVSTNNYKGYTPLDISSFCNKFKIECFSYDFKMERCISNKGHDIVFNANLPAFVYYFNDEHIDLINDKEMQHSFIK